MPDDGLAQWGQMSYAERAYVLQQNNAWTPEAQESLLQDEIKRQYGYLSVFMDNPEIGPLLRTAAQQGWTQDRLQADLYKTSWWQNTSATSRQWDLLTASDPAEARRRIESGITDVQSWAGQQGITLPQGFDLVAMVGNFLRLGFTQAQIQSAVAAQSKYNPGSSPLGTMGQNITQIKSRASDYGVQISDQAAFDWSRQMAMGTANQDSYDVYLRDQAKSRYSWLADDLDRGATVRQLFDPMIQQTAQLLEISPSQIDLNDPKYQQMIDFVDPKTGIRRSMTTAEAATYARSTPEWQTTDNATHAASAAAESILKTFGKVSD